MILGGAGAGAVGAASQAGTSAMNMAGLKDALQKLGPGLIQQGAQQDALINKLAPMGPPPQPMVPQGQVPGVGQVIGQMQGMMAPQQPRNVMPPQMMRGEMLTRPQVPGVGGAMMGAY